MVTVLVTGGRRYDNEGRLYQVLDAAVLRLDLTELIHGDATGADELAKFWAIERGIGHHEFKARWDDLTQPGAEIHTRKDGSRYDAKAGPRRNQQMLEQGRPRHVIAFRGGDGTRDMIRRARAAGVEVFLIDWKG